MHLSKREGVRSAANIAPQHFVKTLHGAIKIRSNTIVAVQVIILQVTALGASLSDEHNALYKKPQLLLFIFNLHKI